MNDLTVDAPAGGIMSSATPPQNEQSVQPQKLELILNPEDGSLQTAPLLSVVMACTDSLYRDIYDMAHGELQIIAGGGSSSNTNLEGAVPSETNNIGTNDVNVRRKDKMANLSFAARRHELSYRLASHSKALTHVAALTSSNHLPQERITGAPANLAGFVDVSTQALTHARTAWIQNDECQDALYFFHGRLFSLRAGPHDVYGALDFMVSKGDYTEMSDGNLPADTSSSSLPTCSVWYDLPSDLRLETDRYETSVEKHWTKQEVSDRWQMAVRRKLLLGEVGLMAEQQQKLSSLVVNESTLHAIETKGSNWVVPWKISLRGGIVRLVHGKAKKTIDNITGKTKTQYPLEAVLTILTTDADNGNEMGNVVDDNAEWTLISVDVCAQAKTGQSNHQLDTTNKQRYNLHRLCALAMAREEKQNKLLREKARETENQSVPTPSVGRPLNALFRVAQYFSLCWQLEILSEQAKALSKGNWGSGDGTGVVTPSTSGNIRSVSSAYSIAVTPVKFFENRTSRILGVLSISFWAVDDRYGPPSIGDLVCLQDEDDTEDDDLHAKVSNIGNGESDSVSTVSRSIQNPAITNKLMLSVRAEPDVGIKVSLSGADSIMEFATNQENRHVRSTIRDLLEATSNPFALSASEALLAATILCAERKCYAMVDALPSSVLPRWITLVVEKGSIVVAAQIQYHVVVTLNDSDASTKTYTKSIVSNSKPVVLFRLACDSRTGSFIPTFSRSTSLLQYMACNDVRAASDTTLLRIANLAKHRRRPGSASAAGAVFGSGRVVRDAFDSLSRSMNVLGQRTGVGGAWRDHDDRSPLLRDRAIRLASRDVVISLMSCCGMSVLYGLSAVAMEVATGIEASPEMSGGKLETATIQQAAKIVGKSPSSFLASPPPSFLVDQNLVEHASWTSDGERIKRSTAEQERFGICCSVDKESGLTLYGAEILVELESPNSIPTRKSLQLVPFAAGGSQGTTSDDVVNNHPSKRMKLETSDNQIKQTSIETRDLIEEIEHFANILAKTIDT